MKASAVADAAWALALAAPAKVQDAPVALPITIGETLHDTALPR